MNQSILIDTNVIISAALSPNSKSYLAFIKAVTSFSRILICQYTVGELYDVFQRKFPAKIPALEKFLVSIKPVINIVPTEKADELALEIIRDPKDAPILRTAIAQKVDYILTGDKDFLVLGLECPKCLTPADLLEEEF